MKALDHPTCENFCQHHFSSMQEEQECWQDPVPHWDVVGDSKPPTSRFPTETQLTHLASLCFRLLVCSSTLNQLVNIISQLPVKLSELCKHKGVWVHMRTLTLRYQVVNLIVL